MKYALKTAIVALAVTVIAAGSAQAQAIGQIFGKVNDASGAVLPGVTVTITGPALQQPLTQVTTDTGAYQFPVVPIGKYTVTFELSGFKKVARPNVEVTSGFNAEVNTSLEVGQMTEEVTVSAAAPVVDTRRAGTGATFTSEVLEKIPTARDPWQIINMTPGVQAGLNVGGSASGQQVTLTSRGTTANVQWNLEGGSMTDLSSNSSAMYYNFDSFEQISVTNGGGDVSVQSSGLSINLVTKSGSNVFKGSVVGTFQNKHMQNNNVSEEFFGRGTSGFLSGAPVNYIYTVSGEYGGPILRNKLWWWAAADRQDINAGVVNYFDRGKGTECESYADAQRAGTLLSGGLVTYDKLGNIKDCLSNDKTVIVNKQGKLNYQLNASNKFQYMFISDAKVRNARGASATTEREAVQKQVADRWLNFFPTPTHQLTHTWIASDRVVFNSMYTYVGGGFYLDYQDWDAGCGLTKYTGGRALTDYPQSGMADCMFNVQPQTIRTTGNQSRSLGSSYQTVRPSHELKTDGTYFLTNVLGGDHSFKFGAGYRKNPILTYSHISGGGRANVQCRNNDLNLCGGANTYIPVGSTQQGLVPYNAVLQRANLVNNDWWMWSAYLQDSYSYKRLRVNAGLRYDWQHSRWLGGCVPANPIRPDLLPAQCEEATQQGISPITGEMEEIHPFGEISPRMSLTYDLQGNGKTVLKASGSYYYATKITLANALSSLAAVTLTWGNNNSSGACSTAANASCWTDANRNGFIDANELVGTPSTSSNRFNSSTGQLSSTGSAVPRDAKIGRTREVTVGFQRELMGNLAVGADAIYRRFDNGTANYILGYQPGAAGFPVASIYSGPLTYTDPLTGTTAPYYVVRTDATRPSGATVTTTRLSYEVYKGLDLTLTKRYSDRWQANVAVTLQTRNDFTPTGSFTDPTSVEFFDGYNSGARYLIKFSGSYDLPWGVMASTNLNINDGAIRDLTINGPGQVFGGVGQSTINRATLNFQPTGTVRYESNALWDVGLHKTFVFRGGQNRVKVMIDGFNILNRADILNYSSDNISLAGSTANPIKPSERISSILPPRIFRVGATISF